jgi:hypothetical protein
MGHTVKDDRGFQRDDRLLFPQRLLYLGRDVNIFL